MSGHIIQFPPIHICIDNVPGADPGDCPKDAKPLSEFNWRGGYPGPNLETCKNPSMVKINGVCTPPSDVPIGALVPGNQRDAQLFATVLTTSYAPDLGIYGTGYDIARAGAFKQLFKADTEVIEQLKDAQIRNVKVSQKNLALIRQILGKAIAGGVSNSINKYRAMELDEIKRIKAQREAILAMRRVLILKYNGIVPSNDILEDLKAKQINLASLNQSGLQGVPLLAFVPLLKFLGYTTIAVGGAYLFFEVAAGGIKKIQNSLNTELQLQEAQEQQLQIFNSCLDHAIASPTGKPPGLGLNYQQAFAKCEHLHKIDKEAFRKAAEKANFMNVLREMSVYLIVGAGLYVGIPVLKEMGKSKAKQLADSRK